MARLAPGATAEQAACRAGARVPGGGPRRLGVASEHALADRPDDARLLVEPGAQGHNEARRAQRHAAAAPPGARRARARGGLRQRVDAAGCARRCASPRLRAAAGARRQPRAASSGSASSKRCCSPARPRSAGTVAGVDVPRRAPRAASLRPQSQAAVLDLPLDGRDPRGTAGVSVACALAFGLLPGAAGEPHRPGDGVPGRRAHARAAAPVVGRRAGCSSCRWRCRWSCWSAPACSRGRWPAWSASTPASISAASCCSASTPRRPAMPPTGFVPLHDRIASTARRAARCPGRDVLARGAAVARAAEQVASSLTGTAPAGPPPIVNTNGVAPNFFAAMALPVIHGPRLHRARIARGRRRWRW